MALRMCDIRVPWCLHYVGLQSGISLWMSICLGLAFLLGAVFYLTQCGELVEKYLQSGSLVKVLWGHPNEQQLAECPQGTNVVKKAQPSMPAIVTLAKSSKPDVANVTSPATSTSQ